MDKFSFSKLIDKFSSKLCIIFLLLIIVQYMADRSFLVIQPTRPYGPLLYHPAYALSTDRILPGKLVRIPPVEYFDTGDYEEEIPYEDDEIVVVEELIEEIIEEEVLLNLQIGMKTIRTLYEESVALNSEVIGYVYIPNSNIQFPILHRFMSDNYYLNNNIYLQPDEHGTIYMDDNNSSLDNEIKFLHGHSMRNGTMFSQLLRYKTQSWADARPYVYIYDGHTTRVYEVFSVIVINADRELMYLGFDTYTDKFNYFQDVLDRSLIRPKNISDFQDILVLNTCSYEGANMRCFTFTSRVYPEHDENGMIRMN